MECLSRASSAVFLTPRSFSCEDEKQQQQLAKQFQLGAHLEMEAPEGQAAQQEWMSQQPEQSPREQQEWVDQQGLPQQAAPSADEVQYLTEAVTAAALMQIQNNPLPQENLENMIGEGEWQKPHPNVEPWEYTKELSSYTGFTSSSSKAGSQMKDMQFVNSGVYVDGATQWNAVTGMPVESPHADTTVNPISRKFTFCAETNEYVNATDASDRVSAQQMHELQKALSCAAVEDTVVDIMRKRSTIRKLGTASKLFERMQKKDLSCISDTPSLPAIKMLNLSDRYIKTYDRTNCMGVRIRSGEHEPSCQLIC